MVGNSDINEKFRQLIPINGLPQSNQQQVISDAVVLEFKQGEVVFRRGDRDKYAFYLVAGELDLFNEDQLVRHVASGTDDALHAMSQLQPRQLTAKTASDAIVLRVDRVLLDKLLLIDGNDGQGGAMEVSEIEDGADEGADWMTIMLQSELFVRVPAANIQRIFTKLESVGYRAGEAVISQGEPGEYYYIIKDGRCEVLRSTSVSPAPIKLAELCPGDSFGEEALVADSKRNATIRMITDGTVMRLTKEDFSELIKKPLIKSVGCDDAEGMVKNGAWWLDVRFPDEHEALKPHFEQRLNIPLNLLRGRTGELDPAVCYIVYCDTGSRSVAGAFLLTERGFDVYHLDGGLLRYGEHGDALVPSTTEQRAKVVEPASPAPTPKAVTPAREISTAPAVAAPLAATAPAHQAAQQAAITAPANGDDGLSAEVRASALGAELAQASLQLKEAQRLKAEAEEARAETERVMAERLESERLKMEHEAHAAGEILNEVKRLKQELEEAKILAEEQVSAAREEEEARIKRLTVESEQHLREEQEKLNKTYAWQAEELAKMMAKKGQVEADIREQRELLQAETANVQERIAAAQRMEQAGIEASRMADLKQHKQMEMERMLRAKIKDKISAERRQLEAEFASKAKLLEEAQREREAAEAARSAASEEADKIISEYQDKHEQERAEEEVTWTAERVRLEDESRRIAVDLQEADRAKEAARELELNAQRKVDEDRLMRAMGGQGMPTEINTLEPRPRKMWWRLYALRVRSVPSRK